MRSSRRPCNIATLRLLAAIGLGGGAYAVYVMACSQTPTGTAALTITTTSPLPGGTVGVPYAPGGVGTFRFQASGDNADDMWSHPTGLAPSDTLPTGLTLGSDGSLTGTPMAAGTCTFTVRLDDNGRSTSKTFTMTIAPPATLTITTTSPLPGGTVGALYDGSGSGFLFVASGGTAPYTWSHSDNKATGDTLPTGLALNAQGALTGVPTHAGSCTFTVKVTDQAMPTANSATGTFTVTVAAAGSNLMVTTTSPLPAGTAGAPYLGTGLQLMATGGTAPYHWRVIAGTPPDNVTLSSGGVLSGTPPLPSAGPVSFTVQVTDATMPTANTAAQQLMLTVDPVLTITTTSLPGGAVNVAGYSQTVTATGGLGPYSWTETGTLPPGLTFVGGVLSGTPSAAGSFTFTAKVTDATTPPNAASQQLTVTITGSPLVITTTSPLPVATAGVPYQGTGLQLMATGGTPPYHWSALTATPDGLTISPAGLLSGTPPLPSTGPVSFTLKVTDATMPTANTASQQFMLTIDPALMITTASLPPGAVGLPYDNPLMATGGTGTYVWSVSSGSAPAGLVLNRDGTWSGVPTTTIASPFSFTLQATSGPGVTATQAYSVTIQPGCSITPLGTLTGGTVGVAYSLPLAAGGTCTLPGNWGITNSPPGLSLAGQVVASTTETLEGTPTTAGRYLFTIGFSDAGATTTAFDTVFVQPVPGTCAIVPVALPDGTVGAGYGNGTNNVLTATSQCTTGSNPAQWTWSVSGAPPGLSLVQGPSQTTPTATLQGTPTTPNSPNSYTFVVTFRSGPSDPGVTQSYTINITPAPGTSKVRSPVRAATAGGSR